MGKQLPSNQPFSFPAMRIVRLELFFSSQAISFDLTSPVSVAISKESASESS